MPIQLNSRDNLIRLSFLPWILIGYIFIVQPYLTYLTLYQTPILQDEHNTIETFACKKSCLLPLDENTQEYLQNSKQYSTKRTTTYQQLDQWLKQCNCLDKAKIMIKTKRNTNQINLTITWKQTQ